METVPKEGPAHQDLPTGERCQAFSGYDPDEPHPWRLWGSDVPDCRFCFCLRKEASLPGRTAFGIAVPEAGTVNAATTALLPFVAVARCRWSFP